MNSFNIALKMTDGREKMAAFFLSETHTYVHTHIYTPHVCTLVHTHLLKAFIASLPPSLESFSVINTQLPYEGMKEQDDKGCQPTVYDE